LLPKTGDLSNPNNWRGIIDHAAAVRAFGALRKAIFVSSRHIELRTTKKAVHLAIVVNILLN